MYHCYNIEKDGSLKSIHLALPQLIIIIVNDQEASYSFVIGYFLHLGGQGQRCQNVFVASLVIGSSDCTFSWHIKSLFIIYFCKCYMNKVTYYLYLVAILVYFCLVLFFGLFCAQVLTCIERLGVGFRAIRRNSS